MMAWRVLVGINYQGRRAEPGDIVDDLSEGDIAWMSRDGIIEQFEFATGGVVSTPPIIAGEYGLSATKRKVR